MDSLHSSRVETRGGYSAEQLEAIKLFGRKDLADYCLVKVDGKYIFHRDKSILESHYEILGHIPHLEDLFRVAAEIDYDVQVQWGFGCDGIEFIVKGKHEWFDYNATLPLLDQPNLSNIISLFR